MHKTSILRNVFTVLAILGVASSAFSAVLFSETFSYPDGHLASAPPNGGVSGGLWTNFGFSFSPRFDVSDGKVTLFQRSHPHQTAFSGEDVKRGFSALATGQTFYAGFDISASGGSTRVEFAQVRAPTIARGIGLFVTPPLSGDFTLGIGNSNSTPAISWPSGLSFNTTYRTVLSYEFDTGISKLWVNPVDQSSTSVSFTGAVSAPVSELALFQSFFSETSFMPASAQVLDNLVVGTAFNDVLTIPAPRLPGDYSGNGSVGPEDHDTWKANFGSSDPAADGNGNGIVDAADYSMWRDNLGAALGSSSLAAGIGQSVPEPASSVLIGIGVAAIGVPTFRQRQRPRKSSAAVLESRMQGFVR